MKTLFPVLIVLAVCAVAPAADPPPGPAGIVLTNDRTIDASSNEAIVAGLLNNEMPPQQKSYLLWRFVIRRNRHKEAAPQAKSLSIRSSWPAISPT